MNVAIISAGKSPTQKIREAFGHVGSAVDLNNILGASKLDAQGELTINYRWKLFCFDVFVGTLDLLWQYRVYPVNTDLPKVKADQQTKELRAGFKGLPKNPAFQNLRSAPSWS